MRDLRLIEARLVAVLAQAAGWLPPEQLEDMESLANHGEPGLALENFCEQIYEYEVKVPEGMARELAEIAAMMGMTVPRWISSASSQN